MTAWADFWNGKQYLFLSPGIVPLFLIPLSVQNGTSTRHKFQRIALLDLHSIHTVFFFILFDPFGFRSDSIRMPHCIDKITPIKILTTLIINMEIILWHWHVFFIFQVTKFIYRIDHESQSSNQIGNLNKNYSKLIILFMKKSI